LPMTRQSSSPARPSMSMAGITLWTKTPTGGPRVPLATHIQSDRLLPTAGWLQRLLPDTDPDEARRCHSRKRPFIAQSFLMRISVAGRKEIILHSS
jgi:hypothetical protein